MFVGVCMYDVHVHCKCTCVCIRVYGIGEHLQISTGDEYRHHIEW